MKFSSCFCLEEKYCYYLLKLDQNRAGRCAVTDVQMVDVVNTGFRSNSMTDDASK